MTTATETITPQAAGAFGEKAVEAELLRRNWIPANVNPTIKNAAQFDIFAWKANRSVRIRVKACRPNMKAFLWGGFHKPIPIDDIEPDDFTIVVRMGNQREEDRFYVVPTKVVFKEMSERQAAQKASGSRKNIGMFHLGFSERRDKREEAGRGIEKKWKHYLGAWKSLDG